MRAIHGSIVVIVIVLLSLGVSIGEQGSSAAAVVTFEPASGPPGTTVIVGGTGWQVGQRVRLTWDDGSELADVAVSGDGAISATFVVPATASEGPHLVSIAAYIAPYQQSCVGETVQVTFTVTGQGTATMTSATASASAPATSTTVTGTAVGTTAVTTTATSVAGTATPCGTSTSAVGTGTSGTGTAAITGTAATGTASATSSTTATTAVTATATNTVVGASTFTATATRTPTRAVTNTPTATRVGLPGTGSGGLLDEGDEGGVSVATALGIVVLIAGATTVGVTLLRRQTR